MLSLFIDWGVVGGFVVRGRELRGYSTVFKIYAINCLKITNRWIHRFDFGVVTVFKGQALLDDLRSDGRRDFATRLAALHKHGEGEFGLVVWREGDEPGIVVFLAVCPSLGSAGFAGYNHAGYFGSTACTGIVDHSPHPF